MCVLKVCAEEFNDFVSALRTKLSSSCGSSEVLLPDTKEELFNKYNAHIHMPTRVHTYTYQNRNCFIYLFYILIYCPSGLKFTLLEMNQ